MRQALVLSLLCSTAIILGCSSDVSETTSQDLGPAGGTIRLSNGTILQVPAGALSKEVSVELMIVSTSGLAKPPTSLKFIGDAMVFRPHGLTFDKPVTVTLPAAQGATKVLRLDDESDTSWEIVTGANIASSVATISTSSFSVYAVAGSDGTVAARGVIKPPEVLGGSIPGSHVADVLTGQLYWVNARNGMYKLARVQLGDTLTPEEVYEESGKLTVVGVGPKAVYFHREDAGFIGRLSHDLKELNLKLAKVSEIVSGTYKFVSAGIVSAEHLYVSGYQRVSLATGAVSKSPFDYPVDERCAMSTNRTQGACTVGTVDFVNGTSTRPKGTSGHDLSNGQHAADSSAFFFTPHTFSAPVYRLPFGSTQPVDLGKSAPVHSAAASNGRLYLGRTDGIITLDSSTGKVLNTHSLSMEPNQAMYVWKDYLYYAITGGSLVRVSLSKIGGK